MDIFLRDQIAAVLRKSIKSVGWVTPESQAEEIIAGLGLRREWGALDPDESGILGDSREEVSDGWGGVIKYRFITDWSVDA